MNVCIFLDCHFWESWHFILPELVRFLGEEGVVSSAILQRIEIFISLRETFVATEIDCNSMNVMNMMTLQLSFDIFSGSTKCGVVLVKHPSCSQVLVVSGGSLATICRARYLSKLSVWFCGRRSKQPFQSHHTLNISFFGRTWPCDYLRWLISLSPQSSSLDITINNPPFISRNCLLKKWLVFVLFNKL